MEMNQNFAFWFDRLFVSPELLGKHGWNAEGIFSTFPAIATGIAGMLAGHLCDSRCVSNNLFVFRFPEFCVLWFGGFGDGRKGCLACLGNYFGNLLLFIRICSLQKENLL
ncbi:MAG: hypothetical protein M0Q53_11535 [Prolixibacteraceae bacterium]|jgi:hypothetical protein|nr:hypothetical protein [Prolixibacteraceae bacterium]